ncbi:FAD-dependent monooxygenase [Streptomyces sp. NBC_00237]|uniref:FAD-dependent monooxygenase n=1 Tax=Streptomyces sp. NBC_00237 TaxID=2975687 RepID=UPI0022559F61|nr:FAD-dependent monooxygenase [Streptomyces sp. NBC_00237]MCX5201337.1 FAD-dependent monooxygenase [Streptomyces sp. NBC_00237]
MSSTPYAPRILVSGASIAGSALTYWLKRYGFRVTVVELTPGFRPGGQSIDVRGSALKVLERMGALETTRARRVRMQGMSVVNPDGEELFRSTEQTLSGGELASPDIEILRDDLSSVFVEATAAVEGPEVEYLFDDSIDTLTQDATGVHVTFRNRPEPRTFDLVLAADGLHSSTRALAFGPESDFVTHMGTVLAVWSAPNFLDLDEWQIAFHADGFDCGGLVTSVRENKELRVYLGFEHDPDFSYDYRDINAQKQLMADQFKDGGWVFPTLLDHMWQADDFHLDSMAQVKMDSWSNGRVALVGDAGYCGSPLSGQGASMAIVGAYVLAGELKAAQGDHASAFAAYESELRGFVTASQELAYINKARGKAQQTGEAFEGPEMSVVANAYGVKDY